MTILNLEVLSGLMYLMVLKAHITAQLNVRFMGNQKMQGKRVPLDVERRIMMAFDSDDIPDKRDLAKRFGVSVWTLWRIRKDASLNHSQDTNLPTSATYPSRGF